MQTRAVLAAVVFGLLLATGCGDDESSGENGPSEPSDRVADLVGLWDTRGLFEQLNDDGTYTASYSSSQANPVEWGTYTVDGDLFTYVAAEDSIKCAGTIGVYQFSLSEDGNKISRRTVDDPCLDRREDVVPSVTRHAESD